MSTVIHGLSSLFVLAAAVAALEVARSLEQPALLKRYLSWWHEQGRFLRASEPLGRVLKVQPYAFALLLFFAAAFRSPLAFPVALAVLVVPAVLVKKASDRRREALSGQLDGTLTSLADSLLAMPNLHDALSYLAKHVESPMAQELDEVLAQARLGRSLDDALKDFAKRSRDPGIEAAVAAAVLGRRTGGDLPKILAGTAAAVREMNRLEGVLKTKTAEGRNQAWVMGLVPPGLVLALHKIDPAWLEPLWQDPIGWIILGVSAVMEISAVILIRRIMAVDL